MYGLACLRNFRVQNVSFFTSRRRHRRFDCDWSSDVCSSDLCAPAESRASPSAWPYASSPRADHGWEPRRCLEEDAMESESGAPDGGGASTSRCLQPPPPWSCQISGHNTAPETAPGEHEWPWSTGRPRRETSLMVEP